MIWFFIIGTPSQVLCKFLLYYFCLSSLGHHHTSAYSLFISFLILWRQNQVLSKHNLLFHWFFITGTPRLFTNLIVCSFASQEWDTIQGSNSIDSLFLWFLIIGASSLVLSQFIISLFGFSSLVHHPWFYLTLIICFFSY